MMKLNQIIVALSLLTALPASSAVISYDWSASGNQGLLGWTTISNSPAPNPFPTLTYELSDTGDALRSPTGTVDGVSLAQDASHATLVVQSPSFSLTSTSVIDFTLVQGAAGSTLVADQASLPTNSITNGFIGLALLENETGNFVLSATRSSNGGPGEALSFSNTQLMTLNLSSTYALQLIDYKQGGWGHVGLASATLTNVTPIPEPTTPVLFALAGSFLLFRRRL